LKLRIVRAGDASSYSRPAFVWVEFIPTLFTVKVFPFLLTSNTVKLNVSANNCAWVANAVAAVHGGGVLVAHGLGTPLKLNESFDSVTDGELSQGAPLCGPLSARLLAVSLRERSFEPGVLRVYDVVATAV
jgi:hypothetical protein